MKNYVENFTKHIAEAIEIGRNATISKKHNVHNILVSGLGGSGIGGSIAGDICKNHLAVPFVINKDYNIPAFVNENTLFIASSYSGNTEETLSAMHQALAKNAQVVCVASGGEVIKIAKEKGLEYIQIPSGHPPRAAFGYSVPQLFFVLHKAGLLADDFSKQMQKAIALIDKEENNIIAEAQACADMLYKKIPVIYAEASYEGVAVRFRQQINENSKMLCWHHVLPEMNHNELVGWREKNDNLAVLVFRNADDYIRTQKRMEFSKTVYKNYTPHYCEVLSKGDSPLERALYLVHLGDWISVHLAEMKNIDAVEVNIITNLKNTLADFKQS
jgi:glucose/mannose-6-phosphate isomerase